MVLKILLFILIIFFGIFMIIFGGMDDSPGAQGIGLITIIAALVFVVKRKRKNSKSKKQES